MIADTKSEQQLAKEAIYIDYPPENKLANSTVGVWYFWETKESIVLFNCNLFVSPHIFKLKTVTWHINSVCCWLLLFSMHSEIIIILKCEVFKNHEDTKRSDLFYKNVI